ncbi:hypothetical protein AB4259_09600 [Vibrio amylolyticus]|uniref:hypothetical protein n=1 Tax=Vibrio amylolyticus TaxID=2847292 RepID=UPI000C81A81F|nr:hypothetical protein BCU12_11455 [Vibrio sp. 10N.261.55.A7]
MGISLYWCHDLSRQVRLNGDQIGVLSALFDAPSWFRDTLTLECERLVSKCLQNKDKPGG